MRRLRNHALRRPGGPGAARGTAARPAVVMALLALVVVTATAAFASPWPRLTRPRPVSTGQPSTRTATAQDLLASLPLSFAPAGDGGFVSRGPGYSIVLSPTEAVLDVGGGRFGLRPAGLAVNPAAALSGGQARPGTVNRLEGSDPAAWTTGVPTFGSVVAAQVWPGVDMVWHGDGRALEHDVVVAPGADPAVVALDVDGAGPLRLDPSGDLLVDLGGTTARLSKPVLYQDVAGARQPVSGSFDLLGPSRIGFAVGPYDHGAPLVIDPTLVTSTTLGGSGSDVGYGIALDAAGDAYVTGSTESADFPTGTPFQPALSPAASGPSTDVFVSKIAPDGTTLLWSTYLGGKGRDTGYSIAVGPGNAVYVSGVTESPDFPRAKAAQDNYGGGPSDAFVARIAANGSGLDWSTFLGGNQTDRARGLAVDAGGNAYVTGSTSSVDFPAVNALQTGPPRADDVDAFVAKIPVAGAPLAYSTRLGGSNDDHGLAIAVDGQGAAYVTGDTLSPGFPTVRPLQAASGGSASGVAGSFPDAFVAKLTPGGNALTYSTFLGGSDYDQGTAIAVDGTGAVYLTGSTNSPNFPTVAPLQARKDTDADAFAAKIDPTGASLVYSTYLGGGGADGGNGITVDGAGDAYLTGTTGSANWPTAKPTQPAKGAGDDGFVAKLNPAGTGLLFSTYIGGRDSDSGMSVAVDTKGAIHVLGLTSSSDFPEVKPLQGVRPPAGGDAFVVSLSVSDVAGTTPSAAAPAAASSSSDAGHSRRVRALGGLTVLLLLVAGLQTLYLRGRRPEPAAKPQPSKPRPAGTAGAGLRVLDDAGIGAGPVKATASAAGVARAGGGGRPPSGTGASAGTKAGGGSRPNRTPKSRGGPKGGGGPAKAGGGPARTAGGPAKAGGAPKQPVGSTPVSPGTPAPVGAATADAGEPTLATPAARPSAAPRPRPQAPAIAQLLEEDLWMPEPAPAPFPIGSVIDTIPPAPAQAPAPPPPAATGPAGEPAAAPSPQSQLQQQPQPQEQAPAPLSAQPQAPPPVAEVPVAPPPALPPVPAEELSFWDLFPEDLPPARPVTYPTEDLLADHLALPDGPDSVAARVARGNAAPLPPPPPPPAPPAPAPNGWVDVPAPIDPLAQMEAAPPPPARPPHPADAEIVIAELLDGPVPTGLPSQDQSIWAPAPADDDFIVDDLLQDQREPTARPTEQGGAVRSGGRPNTSEQNRIAADQARRRRARRGDGGRRGGRPGGG